MSYETHKVDDTIRPLLTLIVHREDESCDVFVVLCEALKPKDGKETNRKHATEVSSTQPIEIFVKKAWSALLAFDQCYADVPSQRGANLLIGAVRRVTQR